MGQRETRTAGRRCTPCNAPTWTTRPGPAARSARACGCVGWSSPVGPYAASCADSGEELRAERVVVCAGAVQTPALLQRSGLGGRFGRGLSVHPTVKVVARFGAPVTDPDDVPTYQVKEFGPWLSFGGSASRPPLVALALSEPGPGTTGCSTRRRTTPSTTRRPGSTADRAGAGRAGLRRARRRPTGLTRRDSPAAYRPGSPPAPAARRRGRQLVPCYPRRPAGAQRDRRGRGGRRSWPARASLMTVHLTGTAAMGEDGTLSRADSYGRVRGWPTCVNDASLLPYAPGVNPQGTIMAIAHRNVDHLRLGAEMRRACCRPQDLHRLTPTGGPAGSAGRSSTRSPGRPTATGPGRPRRAVRVLVPRPRARSRGSSTCFPARSCTSAT